MAIPRELYLDENGKPACKFIDELGNCISEVADELTLENANMIYGESNNGRLHGLLYWNDVPDTYRLRFTMKPETQDTVATLFLRTDNLSIDFGYGISKGYQLIFDFPSRVLRLREHYTWDQRPDIAFIPLRGDMDRTFQVDVVLDKDILEVEIDDKESLVYRLSKYTKTGGLALLSVDGCTIIDNWMARHG